MTAQKQLIFWGVAVAVFLLLVAVLGSVLFPFVLGMAIAYLLNPLVIKLSALGFSRRVAAFAILGVFALLVAGALAAALPLLYRETLDLAQNMPGYVDALWQKIEPHLESIRDFAGEENIAGTREFLKGQAGTAAGFAGQLLAGMAAGGQAVLHFLGVLFITPVVAYFMMKEWPAITGTVRDLMPREHKNTILGLLRDIDRKLAGLVRGQLLVMLVLGVGYAVALTVAGLKYGFLIGLVSGLLSVVPMVGSTIGFILGTFTAFFQTGDWTYVAIIAAIFIGGQLIEGNLLTPVLVGGSIGLHPLWIFFALMVGGALFGFLGILLAVPVAVVASVLIGFGLRRYKNSAYYKGK